MCTAVCFSESDFYFGRTFDYEFSYGEEIAVIPRNFKLDFSYGEKSGGNYAVMGTAYICDDYPLFFDAVNECGLCMAGLNFIGNAEYKFFNPNKKNAAQYEFILWVLRQCGNTDEAKILLSDTNITAKPFNETLPASELHWIIAGKHGALTVEATDNGIEVYDNYAGILTNNPPFPVQMFGLNDYAALSVKQPQNSFLGDCKIEYYSRGMGAIGLPGDWSSRSRFVRGAFVRANSIGGSTEEERISRLFHILDSVTQVKGCCDVGKGLYEYTIYSSCINADKGIYYYKTYNNGGISAVDMNRENLDSANLIRYPMKKTGYILFQN